MIDQFNRLPVDEQNVILDACMAEFAENGYLRASTNQMVKQAGIPKGTLFYYFGSKRELFLYLLDRALGTYQAFVGDFTGRLPSDLFDRIFYMVDVRMQFALRNPDVYHFLFKALLNIPDELKVEMEERFAEYAVESQRFLRENVDTSMLREGVTLDQVLDLVGLLQEGMLSRFAKQLSQMEPEETIQFVEGLLEKTQAQFNLVKKGVYL